MFTGLVEDIGKVEAVEATGEGSRLRISTRLGSAIQAGDRVAFEFTSTGMDGTIVAITRQ